MRWCGLLLLLVACESPKPVSSAPTLVAKASFALPDAATDAAVDAAVTVDAAPPVLTFCSTLASTSSSVALRGRKLVPKGQTLPGLLGGSGGSGPGEAPTLPNPSCTESARFGWGLRIDKAALEPMFWAAGPAVGWAVVLVHGDNGSLVTQELPFDRIGQGANAIHASVIQSSGFGERYISAFVFGDIDGDGDPEVFVSGGYNQEGPDPIWGRVFTFKNGAIRDYAPGFEVRGAADVDHDGRLDLMTPGPYASIKAKWNGVYEYAVIGGVFTAHALAGGTFSMTDAVAKSALLKECPRKAPLAVAQSFDIDQTSHDILCARVWGASEADVRSALAGRCKSFDDADPNACPKVFLAVAKVTPPTTLP